MTFTLCVCVPIGSTVVPLCGSYIKSSKKNLKKELLRSLWVLLACICLYLVVLLSCLGLCLWFMGIVSCLRTPCLSLQVVKDDEKPSICVARQRWGVRQISRLEASHHVRSWLIRGGCYTGFWVLVVWLPKTTKPCGSRV